MGTGKKFLVNAVETADGVYRFSAGEAGTHKLIMGTLQNIGQPETTTMNPVELLLSGIAGCLGLTLRHKADSEGVPIEDLRIKVEGVRPEGAVRSGVHSIQISVCVKTTASVEKIRELVEESEAACTVSDTLTHAPLFETVVTVEPII